jgi:hypothetical protein
MMTDKTLADDVEVEFAWVTTKNSTVTLHDSRC